MAAQFANPIHRTNTAYEVSTTLIVPGKHFERQKGMFILDDSSCESQCITRYNIIELLNFSDFASLYIQYLIWKLRIRYARAKLRGTAICSLPELCWAGGSATTMSGFTECYTRRLP